MKLSTSLLLGGLASAFLVAGSLPAAVTGNLDTGSSGSVTVTLNDISFNNDPSAVGGGNSNVASSTNLSFAGCPSGILGQPGCLFNQEGVTVLSPLSAASIGANNFLTFAAHPNLVYSLLSVGPGAANTDCSTVDAPGESCSVFAGSPIVLTYNTATSTRVGLAVGGRASDTGIAGLASGTLYTGGFSQTLTTLLPNGLVPTASNIQLFFCPSGTCTAADFQATGRAITTSQSGSFFATADTPIPEPGTYALALLGIAGIMLGRYRRS